ncbi:DUF6090 family protein [Sediminicola arcticus]|jgi:hypothetical protein|uniref:DUF6090 family protein n=1 Tax=Sediminicola arcticus TaxID=1574308 RepID=A0ABV2SY27_9FLAO
MIKFFRKIRQNLLMENKTGRYFKYAIGEIILVVIGILIALSINNWNEESKDRDKLLNIYSLIYNDIEDDIKELQKNVEFYNEKKSVFEKVVHDSITPDLLDQGLSSLISNSPRTLLNKKGVSQLRQLQENDTLTFYLNDIYEFMDTRLLPLEISISNEVIDHKKYVRDNHEWYPEWINNTITRDVGSKELHDYFLTNPTYRNRVVFVYDQVYNSYVRSLNALIKGLTTFKEEIGEILKKEND